MTINPSELLLNQRGLAVEGKNDKLAIEAFLDAGQNIWGDWTETLVIQDAGGFEEVVDALTHPAYFGLVDRDWRTLDEIGVLQKQYPKLYFLPRLTIENYFIDPKELLILLSVRGLSNEQTSFLTDEIEKIVDDWLQFGALWKVTYLLGADKSPYPAIFRRYPPPPYSENEIFELAQQFHQQIEPNNFVQQYRQEIANFRNLGQDVYRLGLHGKHVFRQVICKHILESIFKPSKPKKADLWFSELLDSPSACPPDLIPILQPLLT